MPYSKVLTRMRGLLAATFIRSFDVRLAMAETTLPQSVGGTSWSTRTGSQSCLTEDDNSRIPIIVEFAAPPVPGRSQFRKAQDAADAAHIASVHRCSGPDPGAVYLRFRAEQRVRQRMTSCI